MKKEIKPKLIGKIIDVRIVENDETIITVTPPETLEEKLEQIEEMFAFELLEGDEDGLRIKENIIQMVKDNHEE